MRASIPRRRRRRGIAILVELALVASVLALVVTVAAGWYQYALDQAKTRQAAVMLGALDRSVRAYADVSGTYPPGRTDGDMRRMLPMLLAVPPAKSELQPLIPALLYSVDGRARCRDPWGSPVRYITEAFGDPALQRCVRLNGNAPIFESAGPDRRFGEDEPACQADNLRSDEPLDLQPEETPPATTQPD